jgi:hypothetical protein
MEHKLFHFFLPLSVGKKRYLLFFILVFFCCYVRAQVVNSGDLYIAGNIFIDSDFTNNSTASYQNDGYLNLTGNFNNDQPIMTEGTGTTQFSGSTKIQKISGSKSPFFHDVVWTNPLGVKMTLNVVMGGTISPVTGSLYFNSYTLAMGGKINSLYTNTSAFNVTNTSDLIIYGNAASGNKIYFDPSANTIRDLTVQSSSSGVLGNALNVTAGSIFGTVTVNGTFDAAGFLTLKSDAYGTARVSNSSGIISNYVTVERYIPPRRAWRFMAAPVNNDTLTIRSAWQEGANNHDLVYANHQDPHPGYGTDITYDNDWTKGFDVNTTYNPSIKVWTQSASNWNPAAPSTATTLLNAYPAYCLFIRGSRAVHLEWATGSPTDPTIIRETGTLNNGTYTKTYTGNSGDYLFVGNPFASSINLATVLPASSGVSTNKFWVWDPAFNGSYGVGGYVTYANGIMVPVTANYPTPTTIIQGEQGFMVQSNAPSSSLVFNQNCKIATEADIFGKHTPVKDPYVYINLMLQSADSLLLVDGTATIFEPRFSTAIDGDDAIKFPNFNESIAMLSNDRRMAIEARPLSLNDTLFLKLTYLASQQPYALSIKPVNTPVNMHAWLIDKYLNTRTPVKLDDTTLYNFTANYYDTTTYMRRFIIIYRKGFIATPVPIAKNEAVAKKLNGSVNILPNPVTGNSFNINLVNVTKGNYKAEIYSNDGKVLLVTYMEHLGGNNTYKANLPPGTAAGIYTVSVIDSAGRLIQKTSLVVSKN